MLINCPDCSKEISDKVKACPNCGCPMVEETAITTETASVVALPKIPKISKKAKTITTIVAIVVVLCGGGLFVGTQMHMANIEKERVAQENEDRRIAEEAAESAKAEYAALLRSTASSMKSSGSNCESLANLSSSVWSNCINEKSDPSTDKYTKIFPDSDLNYFWDDFNSALSNMFIADETVNKISKINSESTSIGTSMKNLNNPPTEYSTAYSTISDLYEAYQSLVQIATDPSGSLQTFNSNKNEKIERFNSLYAKLLTQLPD